jgi:hypothetical protein
MKRLAVALCIVAACASRTPQLTEITFERSCSGCPAATLVVIRSDGRATLTSQGNARFGTTDSVVNGAITREQFAEVARLLAANGFFEMQAEYRDPQIQDAPWTRISAVRDGVTTTVIRRDAAGPAGLDAIERALDDVARTIKPGPLQ